ncbi:MAG: polysaccharide biosynthesis protein [Tissierellia bacterium]|nr:polysaccharide biosynthesis protein [Tissierellia bacterium]
MGRKVMAIIFLLIDAVLINLTYILSLIIRFEEAIYSNQFILYFTRYKEQFIYITLIKLIIFAFFKMYRSIWRYASVEELVNIVLAAIVSNLAILSYTHLIGSNLPISVYIIATLFDMMFIGGARFCLRVVKLYMDKFNQDKNKKRIMIIGAGEAGVLVIKEYKNHPQLNSKPVALIDDDEYKQGRVIMGVPVVGKRDDILAQVEKLKIDEIILAMPSASKKDISSIVDICKKTKAKLKILPGVYELIDGKVTIKNIRDVQIEDLLGREEIKTDINAISSYIKDKVILVTGGGGSIGSELCRQIANIKPRKLVIIEIYENSAYDIENELLRRNKDLNLKIYIASIVDRDIMFDLFNIERPDVVFHAAAHKHVPLMEASPKESIKNNVFGTLNLVHAADKYGVKKFVMISTDKAVNPTNIMGASKRICEMIIQSVNPVSKTDFVAVRFGNVLGSNGSVIPLFKKQIEEGGPVTVTHKDVIRYFMTIPEAVSLVIQAGAIVKGGEIFVLDMGKPVKILDLAEDLIRLSGFEPYKDIQIEIIGLRPGEKLYEELFFEEENVTSTMHDKIFVAKPTFTDYKLLMKSLEEAKRIIKEGTDEDLKVYIQSIVPNYTIQRTPSYTCLNATIPRYYKD